MTVYVFIAAICIMLASLAGVVFADRHISGILARNLKILIAFAGGVFAVLAYSLFAEVLEMGISATALIVSALLGALFLEVANHIIPSAHHHHDTAHDHTHGRIDARRMLIGDAVHNIGDGIILVPAFLAGPHIGIATAGAIFLHELVQEIAEFFVLREAGYSTREALVRNFAVSATILIGVGIAFLAIFTAELETPLLAFAAGGFVYIIARDLLPSVVRSVRGGSPLSHFIGVATIGALLMGGVQALTPHTHHHSEEEHLHEHEEHEKETGRRDHDHPHEHDGHEHEEHEYSSDRHSEHSKHDY